MPREICTHGLLRLYEEVERKQIYTHGLLRLYEEVERKQRSKPFALACHESEKPDEQNPRHFSSPRPQKQPRAALDLRDTQ